MRKGRKLEEEITLGQKHRHSGNHTSSLWALGSKIEAKKEAGEEKEGVGVTSGEPSRGEAGDLEAQGGAGEKLDGWEHC